MRRLMRDEAEVVVESTAEPSRHAGDQRRPVVSRMSAKQREIEQMTEKRIAALVEKNNKNRRLLARAKRLLSFAADEIPSYIGGENDRLIDSINRLIEDIEQRNKKITESK